MTALVWDKAGERIYQTGVDRGVLYLKDGTAVVWNGITGVDEGNNSDLKSYYLDGVKFLESVTPGDFVGKLTAFTYPDEFDQVNGIASSGNGLNYYEQPPKSFNLTYRTLIGNDVTEDFGYKIHLFYNLLSVPDSMAFSSKKNPAAPSEFTWSLTGTPPIISGHRPTVHISIDSRDTDPPILAAIENILYGNDDVAARFPTIDELEAIFGTYGFLIIIDNGNGTWLAVDTGDQYISMLDDTTFQIDHANAVYLDSDTYEIWDTDPPITHLVMNSSGGDSWEATVTNDGYIDISSSDSDGLELTELIMKSEDDTIWAVTFTDDGTIDVSESVSTEEPIQFWRFFAPDMGIWVVTVTNDGTLNIEED